MFHQYNYKRREKGPCGGVVLDLAREEKCCLERGGTHLKNRLVLKGVDSRTAHGQGGRLLEKKARIQGQKPFRSS